MTFWGMYSLSLQGRRVSNQQEQWRQMQYGPPKRRWASPRLHGDATLGTDCELFNNVVSSYILASNGRMIDEQWVGKDLEGNGSGMIGVLFRNFLVVTEETPVRAAGVPALILTGHVSNTGASCDGHSSLLGAEDSALELHCRLERQSMFITVITDRLPVICASREFQLSELATPTRYPCTTPFSGTSRYMKLSAKFCFLPKKFPFSRPPSLS
jgi:hypothetical protein